MKTMLIYWPILAVLLIPIWVLLLNALRKKAARQSGEQHADSAINNKGWPLPVVLTSNALENQFQFPIVFYVLCLILAQLGSVSIFALIVAWFFALARWGHALVHVTSNTITYRLSLFGLSCIALLVLFAHVVMVLLAHSA
ncbi:MAPEG family protein [Arenicella xantha]|uniref:MAPEG family protein n=1 Tax=Arenicella xantha TaxID=644221 RepID=A0A395JLT6_9GAMM|nr:MAPEG family protein [Arenicella xantha]RBP50817.1 hypothetical protein DFR28_102233 [Arenicella xantha]